MRFSSSVKPKTPLQQGNCRVVKAGSNPTTNTYELRLSHPSTSNLSSPRLINTRWMVGMLWGGYFACPVARTQAFVITLWIGGEQLEKAAGSWPIDPQGYGIQVVRTGAVNMGKHHQVVRLGRQFGIRWKLQRVDELRHCRGGDILRRGRGSQRVETGGNACDAQSCQQQGRQ